MKKRFLYLLTPLLVLGVFSLYAHSGKTDAKGGHTDSTTGKYHMHDKDKVTNEKTDKKDTSDNASEDVKKDKKKPVKDSGKKNSKTKKSSKKSKKSKK